MTYHLEQTRKAMTAIAAVLAFSSTPLLAQDSGTPSPIVDPAPEPVAPAADPLAPEPAPAESTAAPVKADAAPAKKATSSVRRSSSATRSITRTAARTTQAAPAASATATAPAAAPAMPAADPALASAAVPVAPGLMPVAPVDQAAQQTAPSASIDPDEALPIAGGAALGLMLLGGAAAMRRRRRRKQDEADEATKMAFLVAAEEEHREHPAPQSEPAFVRASPPRHDPVPARPPVADVPTTELPEEFDLSRFGPNVQAAYRGPTEDNPSLSLKHRLRRASFLDQQDRRAVEEAPAETAMTAPATVQAQGKWESRPDSDFLFYRAGPNSSAKKVHQDS